jgi:hypothetical protein
VLPFSPMPLRVCTVSFKSPIGVAHSVEVEAETLYEVGGMGLGAKKGWLD